jgi:hypothetical protein
MEVINTAQRQHMYSTGRLEIRFVHWMICSMSGPERFNGVVDHLCGHKGEIHGFCHPKRYYEIVMIITLCPKKTTIMPSEIADTACDGNS